MIISRFLTKSECKYEIVENGEKAVGKVQQQDVDIILMDIQMPVMDGVEAFQKLSLVDGMPPIVALTANGLKQDIQKYQNIGFVAVVTKPIDEGVLRNTIVRFNSKNDRGALTA